MKDEWNGRSMARGALVIVVVGIALGLGYNGLLLASGPRHGIAWVKQETHMGKLADVQADSGASLSPTSGETPGTTAQPPLTESSSPQPASVTTPSAAPESHTPAHGGTAVATKTPPSHSASTTVPSHTATPTTPSHASHASAGSTPSAPPLAKTGSAASQPPASSPPVAPAVHPNLPVIPDTREPLEVEYPVVKKFWDAKAALILDARSPEEYAEGHIPGAVSLPFDDVFKNPDKAKQVNANGRVIITYCSGGDCELSKSLAAALIDAGQKKVLVFTGGMPGWKDGGAPVTTGATP